MKQLTRSNCSGFLILLVLAATTVTTNTFAAPNIKHIYTSRNAVDGPYPYTLKEYLAIHYPGWGQSTFTHRNILTTAIQTSSNSSSDVDSDDNNNSDGLPIMAKIVGGTSTTSPDWFVQLRAKGYEYTYPFCGGTLIAKSWVLTAAHCVVAGLASDIELWVGATNSYGPEGESQAAVRYATEIITHEGFEWEPYMEHDIALIRLNEEVSNKALAKLPSSSETKDSTSLVAMGTGLTIFDVLNSAPETVRKVTLPYISRSNCQNMMGFQIAPTTFCAGYEEGGKDGCQGDSGGPLFTSDERTVVGITSWGIGCALPDQPGAYTDVHSYLDWINDRTGGGCSGFEDGYTCDDDDGSTINDYCLSGVCRGQDAVTSCSSSSQCAINSGRAMCQESSICKNGQCVYTNKPVGTACAFGYCDKKGKCSHIAVENYGQEKTSTFNVVWMHAYGVNPENCKADFYKIDWSVAGLLAQFDATQDSTIRCKALNEGPGNNRIEVHIDIPTSLNTETGVNIALIDPSRSVWSDPLGLKFAAACQLTNNCPKPIINNWGWGCSDNRCLWMTGDNLGAACSFVIHHPTWALMENDQPVPLDTIFGNCDGSSATIRIPDWIMESYTSMNILANINNAVWSEPIKISTQ